MEKQEAYKSYVFDKGYKDIYKTFSTLWKRTFEPVKKEKARIRKMFMRHSRLAGIFTFIADIPIFFIIILLNIILNSVISLILLIVFIIGASVLYPGFLIVCFADWLYRTIKKISSKCPECQQKFDLPVYRCSCGRIHTRLIPSTYGVFYRKCLCGKKIPTTFFNGRQKLEAFCPHCKYPIKDGGRHVDICIPVVGGPGAGKSCFISSAISQIEYRFQNSGTVFEYAEKVQDKCRESVKKIRNNEFPDKTTGMSLQYYQFYLTPKEESVKRLISICDVGGEVYENEAKISNQIGYRYANAFIMVIDPLSIKAFKNEAEKNCMLSAFNPSFLSIDEILNRLTVTLENMYSIDAKTMLKTNVAVVVTKCDIPGLNEQIGPKAVLTFMNRHKVSEKDALNSLCENFLCKYGENNFINNIKSKFSSVQFFTCSCKGFNYNSDTLNPEGVTEPVMWIYNKIFNQAGSK